MVKNTWMSMIAAGLMAGLSVGCSSVPTTVVRGQSPEEARLLVHQEQGGSEAEITQTKGGTWTGESRTRGELRGLVRGNLRGQEVSHFGYRTPASACPDGNCYGGNGYNSAASVSPHWRWGNFDSQPAPSSAGYYRGGPGWGGNCPPNHQEQCWDHGGRRHRGNYHYHTYSYKHPRNLVYPQPNQPGGAVTYPYYTHKGPSDFFWKGDGSF